jgi:hypothetical protein
MPTYTWTIAPPGGADCGYCSNRVREGDAVELISRPGLSRKLVRCELCAHTAPNETQIEAARLAEEARHAAPPEPPPTLSNTRPTYRHTPRKPATAFSKLSDVGTGFDLRRAAANDHD